MYAVRVREMQALPHYPSNTIPGEALEEPLGSWSHFPAALQQLLSAPVPPSWTVPRRHLAWPAAWWPSPGNWNSVLHCHLLNPSGFQPPVSSSSPTPHSTCLNYGILFPDDSSLPPSHNLCRNHRRVFQSQGRVFQTSASPIWAVTSQGGKAEKWYLRLCVQSKRRATATAAAFVPAVPPSAHSPELFWSCLACSCSHRTTIREGQQGQPRGLAISFNLLLLMGLRLLVSTS